MQDSRYWRQKAYKHLLVGLLVARDDARAAGSLRRGRQCIAERAIVCAGVLGCVRHDGHVGKALAVQRRPGARVPLFTALLQT